MASMDRSMIPMLMRERLGERLLVAFMDSLKLCLITGHGITLECFLLALYRAAPEEVGGFFVDAGPLEKRLRVFGDIEAAEAEIMAGRRAPGGESSGVYATLEEPLVEVLMKVMEGAKAGERADIAEFLGVVGGEPGIVKVLWSDLGLRLKSASA